MYLGIKGRCINWLHRAWSSKTQHSLSRFTHPLYSTRHEVSLPCPQTPAAGFYPKPYEPNP